MEVWGLAVARLIAHTKTIRDTKKPSFAFLLSAVHFLHARFIAAGDEGRGSDWTL
jgi:hypothetical protein